MSGIILLTLLALAGCAGDNERDMKSGADQTFERARSAMDNGDYRNAITYYEALEARFPFSNQSKQAQLYGEITEVAIRQEEFDTLTRRRVRGILPTRWFSRRRLARQLGELGLEVVDFRV